MPGEAPSHHCVDMLSALPRLRRQQDLALTTTWLLPITASSPQCGCVITRHRRLLPLPVECLATDTPMRLRHHPNDNP